MYSKGFGIQAHLNFPTLFPITSVHTTSSSGRGSHLLFLIRALGHLMPGLFSYCPFCLLLNSQLRLFSIHHPRLNPNTNAFGKTFLTFPHGSNLFFCTIKLSQHLFENTCAPPTITVKCMLWPSVGHWRWPPFLDTLLAEVLGRCVFPLFETRWARGPLEPQNMLEVIHNPVPGFGFGA